jgi:hypothetical protein
MSQESNKHGHEERSVDHENAKIMEEALVRLYDLAGVRRDGTQAVCRGELV